MSDEIQLSFDVPNQVYRRAITTPLPGTRPEGAALAHTNSLATVMFVAGALLLGYALFLWQGLLPFMTGVALGTGTVLTVWWRQHRVLVARQDDYNRTAGRNEMQFGADGVVASRPGIESRISWSFVTGIRGIDGATLIELPTARLIVPDEALDGLEATAFRDRLEQWRTKV